MKFIDTYGNKKHIETRFHPESRLDYRAKSVEQLFEDDYALLKHYLTHHQTKQVPRIIELKHYAEGINHRIFTGEQRRKDQDMEDARVAHNFAQKIVTFRKGYLVGNPIKIEYSDGTTQSRKDIALNNIAVSNNFDNLNREVTTDFLKFGRAFELAYYTESEEIKFKRTSPEQSFVVRSNDLDNRKIAGVYYFQSHPLDASSLKVQVRDDTLVYHLEFDGESIKEEKPDKLHGFEHVPMIEHRYNEEGLGVYETELDLIDLYDMSQSDTANYMADLADAILAIFGDMEFPPDVNTAAKQIEYMKSMRKARLMQLVAPKNADGKEGHVDAKYLYKQYDVSGTESYKDRIMRDIYDLTLTPNTTDENFSGQSSGEAMKYKHFGLDQDRASTESLFESTLRERIELAVDVYPKVADNDAAIFSDFDMSKLKITFTPNLPKSDAEVVNMAKQLYGMVSDETVLKLLKTVTNVDAEEELDRMKDLQPEPRIVKVGAEDGESEA